MINKRDLLRLRIWTNDCDLYFSKDYKMIYDAEILDYTKKIMLSVSSYEKFLNMYDVYNIMLCSGIKDSKGKLIYENDIVEEYYNKKRIVKYQIKHGEYKPKGEPKILTGFYKKNIEDNSVWKFDNYPNLTIIGNIYETAEFNYLNN